MLAMTQADDDAPDAPDAPDRKVTEATPDEAPSAPESAPPPRPVDFFTDDSDEPARAEAARSVGRDDADDHDHRRDDDHDDDDEDGGYDDDFDFDSPRARRGQSAFDKLFRKAVERGLEAGLGALETSVGAARKGVEVGRESVSTAKSSVDAARKGVREVLEEVPVPKEAASYVFQQMDETKNVLIRAVAGEVRDFLEATDVAYELQRALTSLSFEIKTEIRFIPNEHGGLKPDVKARARPRRTRRGESAPAEGEE